MQLSDLHRSWRHTHAFAEMAGGTELRDVVDYELPSVQIGRLAHALFVRRLFERIFEYRRAGIAALFTS